MIQIRIGLLAFGAVLVAATGMSFADETRPWRPSPVLLVQIPALDAEYRLAQRYERGDTVPQNFALAAYWYQHAAERGYPPAQLALAQCYSRGLGILKDPVLAYMWANLAASQLARGTPEGDLAQGYRDFARFKLLPAEQLAAQEMATAWRPLTVASR